MPLIAWKMCRGFIYEPFPVESSLHEQLTDHLNAEIVAKTIRTPLKKIDYIDFRSFRVFLLDSGGNQLLLHHEMMKSIA